MMYQIGFVFGLLIQNIVSGYTAGRNHVSTKSKLSDIDNKLRNMLREGHSRLDTTKTARELTGEGLKDALARVDRLQACINKGE